LSKRNESILWLILLLVAAFLRIAPIGASLPYIDYIDEGYALHQTIHVLNQRTLDTAWYGYPSLPAYLNAAALTASGPIYRQVHGHSFRRDLPREEDAQTNSGYNYDLISPPELILAGRFVTAALSIATVLLAGVIASKLRGRMAGLLALLFTALCPALVLRASNVIVDVFATFFALLAMYFSGRIRPNDRWTALNGAVAGFAAGLAFASKYAAGAVFIAILVVIGMLPAPGKSRLRPGLIAAAGLLLGIALGAPATFLHWRTVVHDIAITVGNYYVIISSPGYFGQAVSALELGWPLAIAGSAGIVLMLRRRESRSAAIAWGAFAVVLLAPFVGRPFQPFRNLLPLVPPFCIAAAIAFSDLLEWAGQEKRQWLLRAMTLALIGACSATLACSLYRPIRQRLTHSESRIQAIDWLQHHATREQSVLGIRELAILPSEWKRLGATATVASLFDLAGLPESDHFDYIVTGDFDLRNAPDAAAASASVEHWKAKTAAFVAVAEFGAGPAFVVPYLWRSNDERIVVLRSNTAKSSVTAKSSH
jgi:4-amino-4-deoxy-L-arabinose transferase-like glycosyltransferase